MKQTRSRWLPGMLFALAGAIIGCRNAARETNHTQHIESGLLTAVVLKGEPVSMTIAERMAHYGVPGVSIAVINNGTLDWAKGYGVQEAGGTEPVTTETRFQAASISKPVTAMAALALVEQGRLRLDEDVNHMLTSWRVPENEFTRDRKVTLRLLLNHSAGVSRADVGSYETGEALPTLVQALDGRGPAKLPPLRIETPPGTEWRYSGGGYSIIQQLMTDVTGEPFPALVRDLVLRRLGMTNSDFSQPLRADWRSIAASGHDTNGARLRGRWRTFPEMAAAGLWTTPSDLARFAIEIQQSSRGKSNGVLSAAMTNQMLMKHLGDYGLGVWLGGKDRATGFSHAGSNEGFTCIMTASVDGDYGAVVMTNGDRGSGLFNEILRAIAREYHWSDYQPIEKTRVSVNAAAFKTYVGEYEGTGLPPAAISADAAHLYITAPPLGPQRVELYPSAEDHFFMLENDIEVTFIKDANGHVIGMQTDVGDQRFTATKVS